jgi:hypothetical protein
MRLSPTGPLFPLFWGLDDIPRRVSGSGGSRAHAGPAPSRLDKTLETAALAVSAGGRFEVILSDGLNSMRRSVRR